MGFLWKKQEKVENMMERYFAGCDKCFDLFEKAFAIYLESGLGQAFADAIEETHQAEAAADDMRREIEYTLYGKALLPDSRGDILGLLETFDRMPGFAENVLFAIDSQRMQIKDKFMKDIEKLVGVNVQAYRLARKAIDNLMNNPRITLHTTKDVDERESESDRIERGIIREIFESDCDLAEKSIMRDLVLLIGEISDAAETAADRIGIVAIKRQI